mmetsp:Transcript_30538/g.59657  ORF Transcript_30538/g.59657 Transcript_30538/m.59657 type:complete len:376 (+) Transcript_30538:81-1208(+)|eukprot:CAMPEP_0173379758 /NCGR_PEP_ID=MMETSP1356-20130122/2578_1 /TAXON_ID=77927 ORGANISM="Hemiselmis virescens, Strain PCC157" /NCGR_SAMPLE_ID=MMETSP1356 /ASSEMBLY_ACC=CAM_ASM_000847 /LENGTH=375 /DNA_ID=CAMNT_0014333155 /DNA_START=63 /DNA_END=1190 /DNA_ORIENTATION=+
MTSAARVSTLLAALCTLAASVSAFSPTTAVPGLSLRGTRGGSALLGGAAPPAGRSLVSLQAKKGGAKKGASKKKASTAKAPSAATPTAASPPKEKEVLDEADDEMLKASMMGSFDPSGRGEGPISSKGAEGMVMPGLPGMKIQLIDEKQVDLDVKALLKDRSLEAGFAPIPKGAIVDEPEKKRLEMLGRDEDAAFGLSGDVMRSLKTATWVCVGLLIALEVFVQSPLSSGLKEKVGVDKEKVVEFQKGNIPAKVTPTGEVAGLRPWAPVPLAVPPGVAAKRAAEAAAAEAAAAGKPAAEASKAVPANKAPKEPAPAPTTPAAAPTAAAPTAAAPASAAPTAAAPTSAAPASAAPAAAAAAAAAPTSAAPAPAVTP